MNNEYIIYVYVYMKSKHDSIIYVFYYIRKINQLCWFLITNLQNVNIFLRYFGRSILEDINKYKNWYKKNIDWDLFINWNLH